MFFPVLNRKCLSWSKWMEGSAMSYTWLGTYYSMLRYAAEVYDTSCHLALYQRKSHSSYLVSKRLSHPPNHLYFLTAPKPSIISNHISTPSRQKPCPFFFPPPCLTVWLTHAALCIAVNSKSIFTLWLSLHTQNSGYIWIPLILVPSHRSGKG